MRLEPVRGQILCTDDGAMPARAAIVRSLQWVTFSGGFSVSPPTVSFNRSPGDQIRFHSELVLLSERLRAESCFMNSATDLASLPGLSSIVCTMALPTTAASDKISPRQTPRDPEADSHRQLGKLAKPPKQLLRVSRHFRRAPVTPVRDTAYTNPRETSAMRSSRSSVLVGAARNCGQIAAWPHISLRSTGKSDGRTVNACVLHWRKRIFPGPSAEWIQVRKHHSSLRIAGGFSCRVR